MLDERVSRIAGMQELSEPTIRSSFVNCSKGEAKRLNLPNLNEVVWGNQVFLSWLDPKSPLKGCLVVEQDGVVQGVLLQKSKAQSKAAQMCQFCLTLHPGSGISLYTAARPGESGRRGNIIGTYLCTNLACTDYVLGKKKPVGIRQMDETLSLEDRLLRTKNNALGFIERLKSES